MDHEIRRLPPLNQGFIHLPFQPSNASDTSDSHLQPYAAQKLVAIAAHP